MGDEIPVYRQQDNDPFSDQVLLAINQVQQAYEIGNYDGHLPSLPNPWTPISVGGDEYKLIATAEFLGISIKRYESTEKTQQVFDNFQMIQELVTKNNLPILMPIAYIGDTLVFPYFPAIQSRESRAGTELAARLKALTQQAGIELSLLLTSMTELISSTEESVFVDPFEDDF